MRPPIQITSSDNPRIKRIVRLRKQRERREAGLFVAEGVREVTRALAAGLVIDEVFHCPELMGLALAELVPALPAARPEPRVFQVSATVFDKMAYCENPQGLLATFRPPAWRLEDLPRGAELFLVAAGTEKPGNLGAMVRSAAAAGATAVLAADADVDPFNPNAIRASTAAVFTMPVIAGSSERIARFLADRGIAIFAATPDAAVAYSEVDLRRPAALVIGAEDTGVTDQWRQAAKASGGGGLIRIPMPGTAVDSLNASTSAAILLFEAVRQRRKVG